MTVLTTKTRDALPDSDFAIPGSREYPIHNEAHARDALSRVSANGTPEQQAQVRAAVHKRYPQIGASERKKASSGKLSDAIGKALGE